MYRYYESCVCGSSATMEAPTNMSYEWKEYVQDWRGNHKHEIRNYGGLGGIPASLMSIPDNEITRENLDDN